MNGPNPACPTCEGRGYVYDPAKLAAFCNDADDVTSPYPTCFPVSPPEGGPAPEPASPPLAPARP